MVGGRAQSRRRCFCSREVVMAQLARRRGISKLDATKPAVLAELDPASETVPLRERFARLRAANALPPRTGNAADKAFFDDLSDNP